MDFVLFILKKERIEWRKFNGRHETRLHNADWFNRKIALGNIQRYAVYVSAALPFLFGDLMMAVGKNVFWWSAAAVAASLPILFIMANQNTILYHKISAAMQRRVFAVRNAVQYSTIPVGIILGGCLADYVFEPFLSSHKKHISFKVDSS